MTDKELKTKILAEIERLMKDVEIHSDIGDIQQDSYYDGRRSVLCLIRDFIGSLPEEPVSEDLEQSIEQSQSKDIHTLFDLAAKALFDIASLLPTADGKEKEVVEKIRLICQDYGFKGMGIK